MPPQPGVFALPYASTNKSRTNGVTEVSDFVPSNLGAGPSRIHATQTEDPKSRKRKDLAAKTAAREFNERQLAESHWAQGRQFNETITELQGLAFQLATHPENVPAYQLRLYPISIERSALLASAMFQERYAMECVQTAYEEERERVEEEWRRGRERIRERLMEGIEERRRRAREDKDGEGTGADATLDSQSRPHITRKLRNKLGGTSPPPTPLQNGTPGGTTSLTSGAITSGPFLNPHSLSVDELPSPFPLPLTSTHLTTGTGNSGTVKRRTKGGGREPQTVGGLGKSIHALLGVKDVEAEQDLIEIRRGKKRHGRTAGGGMPGK